MKYLKEAPFIAVTGEPFIIQTSGKDSEEATVGAVIKLLLERYQPVPAQGRVLEIADLRRLNKALDTLDSGPDDDGYYAFEDEHWGVTRKVISWNSPLYLVRNAPLLDDVINAVGDKK